MAYRLYFGSYLLYDGNMDGYRLGELAADFTAGEAGTLTFRIFDDHPNISHLAKLKGSVRLYEDSAVIFNGRIVSDTRDFWNARTVTCEGGLAYLNDSVIGPHNFPQDFLNDQDYQEAYHNGNVVQYYFAWLIAQHNAQVTAGQKLTAGTVSVHAYGNYFERVQTEYTTTLDALRKLLTETELGGYVLPAYSGTTITLDYLADYRAAGNQPIEFAKNLLDMAAESDGKEAFSQILPTGKDGLDISTYSDGAITSDLTKTGLLITSASRQTAYGNITKHVSYDDEETTAGLVTRAAQELAASGLAQTVTVKAADLHFQSAGLAHFAVGQYARLQDTPHGFAAEFPITAYHLDCLDPAQTAITLGLRILTQTDINRKRDYRVQIIDTRTEEDLSEVNAKIDANTGKIEDVGAAVVSNEENLQETLGNGIGAADIRSTRFTGNYIKCAGGTVTDTSGTTDTVTLSPTTEISETDDVITVTSRINANGTTVNKWKSGPGSSMTYYLVQRIGTKYFRTKIVIEVPSAIDAAGSGWIQMGDSYTWTRTYSSALMDETLGLSTSPTATTGQSSISTTLSVTYQVNATTEAATATNNALVPAVTNAYKLGSASYRWKDIYSQNAVSTASARIFKRDIADLDERHDVLFDHLRPRRFKFTEGHREHYGLVLDELADAMSAAGLSSEEVGAYVLAHTENPTGEGCIRYEELISLLIREVQELKRRIDK